MNDVRNRSMLAFHHRISKTFYEIVGSAPLGVIESLCREVKIGLEDFMVIKSDNDVLSAYGDIFGYLPDGG